MVSKENGGKADALNVGLNVSSSELVCAIDADTILDPDGLRRLVRPFIRSDDVVAAGATIRVANGCTVTQGRLASERGPHRAVAGIQAVEYLRAFLFGRPGWNRLGGNLLISGAFGLFRRQSLLECERLRQERRRGHGAHRSAPATRLRDRSPGPDRVRPRPGGVDGDAHDRSKSWVGSGNGGSEDSRTSCGAIVGSA